MGITLVLGISVLLQFTAALLALRLIRVTGRRTAWILIALAISLVAVRRILPLLRLLSGDFSHPPDLTNELVGLAISMLILIGVSLIAPLFLSIGRSGAELKKINEKSQREITERKQAEEALRIMSAYNRSLIETSLDPLVTISPEGKIADVNTATEEVTGFTRKDLIDKDFLNYFTEPEKARAGYQKVFRDGFVRDYELGIRHRDGHVTPVLYNASVYRDESGKVTGVFAAARDITERKQAEESIKKLNEELKRRNIELEALNKELEAFSYSASHDLRAPLRSIDSFSQALLEDYTRNLDSQGEDYLQRVRGASQRMAQLIDDMLKLSKVTRSEINPESVNLSELAEMIVAEFRKTQPKREVEFIIAEGLVANGDLRLLRTMLENLLGNAWKFTGKHSQARIEFGVTEYDGKPVYFIRDDGAGFEMKYADKLFVPFQRLHTEDEFPGTGIGLATVQRIINRHGGRVWAEGTVEKGATFYFAL